METMNPEQIDLLLDDKRFQAAVAYYEGQKKRSREYYQRNKVAIVAKKVAQYHATHPEKPAGGRGRPRKKSLETV
jgi:hypothetical protein